MNYDNISTFIVLSFLEIILGFDNLIFISILIADISDKYRDKVRLLGLSIALVMRLVILFGVSLILSVNKAFFSLFNMIDLSIKDLIMIFGGLFLIYKTIMELWRDFHAFSNRGKPKVIKKNTRLSLVVLQIITIDLVFSIDSILTAIGLTKNITVIALAFISAMVMMIMLSKHTVSCIKSHPAIKNIAIVFIFLIGCLLVCEGLHIEIDKNYIYAAFIFSLIVEGLNILQKKSIAI